MSALQPNIALHILTPFDDDVLKYFPFPFSFVTTVYLVYLRLSTTLSIFCSSVRFFSLRIARSGPRVSLQQDARFQSPERRRRQPCTCIDRKRANEGMNGPLYHQFLRDPCRSPNPRSLDAMTTRSKVKRTGRPRARYSTGSRSPLQQQYRQPEVSLALPRYPPMADTNSFVQAPHV